MSHQEYKRRVAQLKPFFTLLLVVAGTSFLVSCGGGENASQSAQDAESISTAQAALRRTPTGTAAASGTVPGAWRGRVPPQVNVTTNYTVALSFDKFTSQIDGRKYAIGYLDAIRKYGVPDATARNSILSRGWDIIGFDDTTGVYQIKTQSSTLVAGKTDAQRLKETGNFASVQVPVQLELNSDSVAEVYSSDSNLHDLSWSWNLDSIKLGGAILSMRDAGVAITDVSVDIVDASPFRVDHEDVTFAGATNSDGTHIQTPGINCTLSGTIYSCSGDGADHGMHVAGTIGARANNDKLGVGVAPGALLYGWSALTSVAVIDSINRAQLRPTNSGFIVNISSGDSICSKPTNRDTPAHCDIESNYIDKTSGFATALAQSLAVRDPLGNTLLVSSSGNSGYLSGTRLTPYDYVYSDLNGLIPGALGYLASSSVDPAALLIIEQRSIIVGSYYLDDNGARILSPGTSIPSPSGRLSNSFILAPGGDWTGATGQVDIRSAYYVGGRLAQGRMHGTSQAAPHVSGVAALLRSILPSATAIAIKEIIFSTADNEVGTKWRAGDGYKYLNAEAAVREAIARRPTAICENQINIVRRISDFDINDDNAWGSATCKSGSIYFTAMASADNIYLRVDNPSLTSEYSYICTKVSDGYDCRGYLPYTKINIDTNNDGAISPETDFLLGWNSIPGTVSESFLQSRGCQPWRPPNYSPVLPDAPLGYQVSDFVFSAFAGRISEFTSYGMNLNKCGSISMIRRPSEASVLPHHIISTKNAFTNLNLSGLGEKTFRLQLGYAAPWFILNIK